ncbi:MAG: TonB-dependent receptor [Burkholderiales bacterium 68-12]|nr:MAG: TonB-dependent receptor [Burkholderiales bacterium 68-12]
MPPRPLHALALAAALALASPLPAAAALAPGAAAEIVSLQGVGEQRAATASAWQPARVAQALAAGDFVRTGEAARMALVFADETQLRLHQNTVLQVKALAAPGQSTTTLRLEAGRAWTQTRRPPGSPLQIETPAATAAIRGTDWDLRVEPDGRTLLTVLSGTVEFGNAQGQVRVGPNEAALAAVGQAPVKLLLAQPRDRVQWVNALQADPLPHLRADPAPAALEPVVQALAARRPGAARSALAAVPASDAAAPGWVAVLQAAIALQEGDLPGARQLLARQTATDTAPAAAWLLQADLQLMEGEGEAALQTLQGALARWPGHPALWAQQARVQLLTDRLDAARATLDGAPDSGSAELALVRAALARRLGDAPATLAAYTAATQLAPQDARGWLGLGSAHTEREDTEAARHHLAQALQRDPQAAGAQGERGTLETFANRWEPAQQAFDAALAAHPADYVALTGLGLLRLKQGRPQEALDAFLRAGVMEPRYARAKVWTGVAYYQLGRHDDAVATLAQASALDDKDPVPWMLLAQIHTDRFAAGEAVQAARAALARMPYLKSLHQLANDQKGSANLGAALAFFGMEDWALELAQQSFSPYWGASHLFLADRYRGEFNKNSALYQGFLTDPMAFGASQRHASLLQQPGSHGAVGLTLDREFYRLSAPAFTLNGMDNRHVPLSWFVKAQTVRARDFPIDVGVFNVPAFHDGSGGFDVHGRVLTLGLGAQPSERLNLFAYANTFDADFRGRNNFRSTLDVTQAQGALGLAYRWGPAAQTWLKIGRSVNDTLMGNYPVLFDLSSMAGVVGMHATPRKQFSDLQLRHTVDTSAATRWSATLEHVVEKQSSLSAAEGLIGSMLADGQTFVDRLLFAGTNQIDRRYTALTLGGSHRYSPAWTVDGALGWQQIRHRVFGQNFVVLEQLQTGGQDEARRHDTERAFTPRLGLVWQPAPGRSLRLAYQDWMRPLSVSTLASVETAGIPVEDQLLEAGGRQRRTVLQWGQEWGPATFVKLRADHLRLTNNGSLGVDLRTPSLPFLEELRNIQLANLSGSDLLEDTPSYERGTLQLLGASANHMFSRQWSGYAKYLHQRSDSSYGADAARVGGRMIPYLPRHTAVLGATWASSARWYVSGRAVYRSERFEDKENLTRRPPGWSLDLMGFTESADKRWVLGMALLNLGGAKSARQKTRFVLDARYRF